MRVSLVGLVVLGVAIVSSGCQPATVSGPNPDASPTKDVIETSQVSTTTSSSTGVAIINLNEIARQLGEAQRWQAELSVRETELNERLELMKMSFEKELEEAKNQLGEEPSTEQEAEIKQMTARFNTSILQEREHARQEFVQFQAGLESEFRKKIKPIALEVAQGHGFAVIMQHNAVFEFAGSADITVPVIERLQGTADFANSEAPKSDRVSRKLPGGGQFRPAN